MISKTLPRVALALTIGLLVPLTGAGAKIAPAFSEIPQPDPNLRQGPPPPGDTVDDPIWIPPLPYFHSGNSCGFMDDYDEVCPFSGSTSADVVFAYQPNHFGFIQIDLCAASYDTKVFVYEDEVTPGSPLACNDDACGTTGFQSLIDGLIVDFGHIYYIVVDGYNGECGDYELFVEDAPWQCVYCGPETIMEAEPDCYDDYVDNYNGGCGSNPVAFFDLEPSDEPIHVCGKSGTFLTAGALDRDTDWYQIELREPSTILISAWGEFPLFLGLVDGREGCEGMYMMAHSEVPGCTSAEIFIDLEPGIYWPWIAPSIFEGVGCGAEYEFTLTGFHPTQDIDDEQLEEFLPAQVLHLGPPRPNPSAAGTSLLFELTSTQVVTAEICDLTGRIVRHLLAGQTIEAGGHQLVWDGTNDAGDPVGSGIYSCRVSAGSVSEIRQLVQLK